MADRTEPAPGRRRDVTPRVDEDEDIVPGSYGGLLGARVRFWVCKQHRRGRVEWRGNVAHCLEDGCGRNSDPEPAPGGGRDVTSPRDVGGLPDRLARALHDADCGCGTYDADEDPRYIDAARAALGRVTSPRGGCSGCVTASDVGMPEYEPRVVHAHLECPEHAQLAEAQVEAARLRARGEAATAVVQAALALVDDLLRPWTLSCPVHPGRAARAAPYQDVATVQGWWAARAALARAHEDGEA